MFLKNNGNLGHIGFSGICFTKRGEISWRCLLEDKIMEVALEAGAEDIEVDEEYLQSRQKVLVMYKMP